jgi:hypothetical protein
VDHALVSGRATPDTTARAGAPARAVVWAGGQATSYLRAGCGAVVLLLMAEHDGPAALEVVALLSTIHLVIAPSVPGGIVVASWLAGVMDGLGIASASIVAERAFMDGVREFASDDGDRVREVTELVSQGRGHLQAPGLERD